MNFLQYLRSKIKKLLFFSVAVSLVSTLVMPAFSAMGAGPRFNFLNGDHELLRAVNLSRSESVFKDPVEGDPGDVFRGIIYYHNGVENEPALNTRVKVTLPARADDGVIHMNASIVADNAELITDTIVDGNVVGNSGLATEIGVPADVAFIPGSVRWFPNTMELDGQSQTLPFGQSGDEIITSQGLKIGDINGCWQYAGYLTFEYTTIRPTTEFTLDKSVRNISNGENTFSKKTNANVNDQLEFKLSVKNSGNTEITGAVLKDILPEELTVISDQLRRNIDGIETTLSAAETDNLFKNGLILPTIYPTTNNQLVITFRATVFGPVAQDHEIINRAVLSFNDKNRESSAIVCLLSEKLPKIEKSKSVKNLTSGIEGVNIAAKAGDELLYSLVTKNTGNADINFTVSDGVADILEYADILEVSDGGSMVDGDTGNNSKLVSYPATNIAPNETVLRQFKIKIDSPLPTGVESGFSYDYILFNNYGNDVFVTLERPVIIKEPSLKIEKLVRDLTVSENDFQAENEAMAGDTLEYRLNFENTGDGFADRVTFTDTLPPNVQYISGSTIISINGSPEHTIADGIIGDGISLDTVAPGTKGYIQLRVVTSADLADGEILTNTGFLTYQDRTISSLAKTHIKRAPVFIPPVEEEQPLPQEQFELPPLPQTGSGQVGLTFLSAFLGGVFHVYTRYRKELNSLKSFA